MNVVQNIENFKPRNKSVLTIGTFDGVHIGHQKIIRSLVELAHQQKYESSILTFFPHPRMILQKDSSLKLINTINERSAIIKQTGVSNLIIHPFTKEFSRLTALEFVRDILVNQLHIKKIIIGYDHQFGRNRTATINDLIEFGNIYDFEVIEITAQQLLNVSISSTKIREHLSRASIKEANKLLGYPFFFSGKVVHGNKIGRTLGYPTANLKIEDPEKIIPGNGIYAVYARPEGANHLYKGMMSIGFRPTVDGKTRVIEVNIFEFNKEIYDELLEVHMVAYLREEKKYESLQGLIEQLGKDKENSLQIL